MKKKCYLFFILLFLCILFCFPSLCFSGAQKGLQLWFNILLPSLLPFLIMSNLILSFGLLPYIVPSLTLFFSKVYHVTGIGCYPILMGFLSGFPIAAKSCADLVIQKKISLKEGQYLLCFVNNASPMFITTYLSCQCLNIPQYKYAVYGIILLSGYETSILYRKLFSISPDCPSFQSSTTTASEEQPSFVQALDQSILQGFISLIKIGGYVMICSIFATIVLYVPVFSNNFRYFILSILELTTGTYNLGIAALSLESKIILSIATTAFGGLCSILQTQSVIAKSGLSIKTYICFKIIQALFTIPFSFLLLIIIR